MIKVILIGKMKNKALDEIVKDFTNRLKHFDKLEIVELKDSTPEKEAIKIQESLKNFKGKIYALSEEGKTLTSKQLSLLLEADLQYSGSAFIIGSAYGLDSSIKKTCHQLLSLSPMTFTHEFARAILLEQLYRAKTISANTAYHH